MIGDSPAIEYLRSLGLVVCPELRVVTHKQKGSRAALQEAAEGGHGYHIKRPVKRALIKRLNDESEQWDERGTHVLYSSASKGVLAADVARSAIGESEEALYVEGLENGAVYMVELAFGEPVNEWAEHTAVGLQVIAAVITDYVKRSLPVFVAINQHLGNFGDSDSINIQDVVIPRNGITVVSPALAAFDEKAGTSYEHLVPTRQIDMPIRKWPLAVSVVAAILAAAGVAYWIAKANEPPPPPPPENPWVKYESTMLSTGINVRVRLAQIAMELHVAESYEGWAPIDYESDGVVSTVSMAQSPGSGSTFDELTSMAAKNGYVSIMKDGKVVLMRKWAAPAPLESFDIYYIGDVISYAREAVAYWFPDAVIKEVESVAGTHWTERAVELEMLNATMHDIDSVGVLLNGHEAAGLPVTFQKATATYSEDDIGWATKIKLVFFGQKRGA